MSFNLNINALIPLMTLLQCGLFATLFILRGQREERYSDYWLATLLILMGLDVVPFMLGWIGIDVLWETYTFLPWDGFGWAIPPATYLFLKSLTNDAWRFSLKRDYWYFLPYIINFTYHLIIGGYGQFNREFVLNWWHKIETTYFISQTLLVLFYALYIYYYYKCWQLYKNYRKWTESEFSDTEKVSYRWFSYFLIWNFVVFIAGGINDIYLAIVKFGYDQMLLSYVSNLFLTYYISLSGFAQARVRHVRYNPKEAILTTTQEFMPVEIEDAVSESEANLPINVVKMGESKSKNTLSEEDLKMWKAKLLKVFDTEKPYLNPELTLSDLAEKLKTNTSILSQVINTGFDKNFNDFVNEYRVEAFKQKIKTPQYAHYTMLAVAYDCGFNSKTTFNRAFKKLTNSMPSDFLQKK
jgi:AraC-like DNA-binding protein